MGILISVMGRKVERCLGYLADRAGFGPVAVFLELEKVNEAFEIRYKNMKTGDLPEESQQKLSCLCKKLLKYTQ